MASVCCFLLVALEPIAPALAMPRLSLQESHAVATRLHPSHSPMRAGLEGLAHGGIEIAPASGCAALLETTGAMRTGQQEVEHEHRHSHGRE